MTESHQLQTQRLVDGQLNRRQVKQLLSEAQADSDRWREIALAFVENQVFEREVRQFVGANPVGSTAAVCDEDRGEATGGPASWSGVGRSRLAMAAMLLMAISFGFYAGRTGPSKRPDPVGLVNTSTSQGLDAGSYPSVYAPYTVQLVDREGRDMPYGRVSLMTESMAREIGYDPSDYSIPRELQSEFNKVGYELERDVRFIEGRLDDGRQLIVPVKGIRVRPYGQ